jgi:hypothetical protein
MDISLSDVGWVMGGLLVFVAIRVAWVFRADIAQAMSSLRPRVSPDRAVAPPVDQQSTSAIQPIATTGNAINQQLNDNTLLPEEAREIIRFQAKVEALADLIKSGQVSNMAKGIEGVFHCSRSGKEDSIYQKARRTLEPLVKPAPQFRPLSPEQQATREALGLPEKV